MRVKLDPQKIKGLKPARKADGTLRPETDYYDILCPGLCLRVYSTGRKAFMLLQRVNGKLQRVTLRADEGDELSLADAREKARKMQEQIQQGHNPAAERRENRTRTFDALFEDFAKAKSDLKTWRQLKSRITCVWLPVFTGRMVTEIRRSDARAVINAYVERGQKTMANHALSALSTMMNFAIDQEWIEHNPCVRIPVQRLKARQHALTVPEMRQLWTWLDAPRTFTTTRHSTGEVRRSVKWQQQAWPLLVAFVKLRLICGVRGSEVIGMRWRDIEWAKKYWLLPETKNGKPHIVPLSPLALDVLRAITPKNPDPDAEVFGMIRHPMDRVGIVPGVGLENFQLRDLRRTCATNLAELGVPRFIVARVLNHADRQITATYDVYTYLKEKREALDLWSRELSKIVKRRSAAA